VSAARVRGAYRARRVHRACVARAAVSRAPVVRGRGPFERKSGAGDQMSRSGVPREEVHGGGLRAGPWWRDERT
jgi:hypothetical protein